MRIRRNRDNRIKIPWYVRHVPRRSTEGVNYTPADFGFRFPAGRVRPQPVRVAEPVTQPATEPVIETGRVPVRIPDPSLEPRPVPEPSPVPEPFPGLPGIPLPGRVPGRPFPVPEGEAPRPPFREPIPLPQFPLGSPSLITDPEYDWEAHFRRILEQYEETLQGAPKEEPAPVTASENPFLKAFQTIMQPILYLVIGREIVNKYVEAKITDPIYSKMLDDPVLGAALREAEKANMDVEKLANYFANYDWDHFDIEEMARDLTIILGAAGAARIAVFFIGRKVAFRI